MRHLPWLLLLWPRADAQAAAPIDCLATAPLPMQVRIDDTPPRQVLLSGGGIPALQVVDAQTGDTLWSAGTTAASQQFAAMTAPFTGSFVALDIDHDGLHDRLYAGDLDGRLWRFDLHHGAAAEAWASGGIFADFSNDAGRSFLAPPDVSLATAPGASPWFHIAIGTAAPGNVEANNRFYVLRDYAPFEPWTAQQYRDWPPLREADLLQVAASQPAEAPIQAGWFVEVGHGDILSAAITVAGRTVFAIADSPPNMITGCRSAFSIATAELTPGRLRLRANGEWRRPLDGDLLLDSAFTLAMAASGSSMALAECIFGTAPVAECDVDLRPHRTWWRREDAE
jgi:hypothetical protein